MDGTHLWNLDGTYNIWMEPEHTQNGWNLFMFPNPTPDTLNWSVMHFHDWDAGFKMPVGRGYQL